jgi:alpha-galactosidase
MRVFAVLSGLFTIGHVHALVSPDGTGRLPALGWSSWNEFGCDITEDVFIGIAEKLTSLGLRELGYEYVNIDDCWSDKTKRRDPQSKELIPDFQKFPKGINHTADRIHAMGFKLGIYSDAGVYGTSRSIKGSVLILHRY